MRILLALIVLLAAGAGLAILFDDPNTAAPQTETETGAESGNGPVEAREAGLGDDQKQPSRVEAEAPQPLSAEPEDKNTAGRGDLTVTGRVIDTSGAPIADAKVAMIRAMEIPGASTFLVSGDFNRLMESRAPNTQTDAEGRFTLFRRKPGKFTLTASHPEHPRAQMPAELTEGSKSVADLVLTMPRGAAVSGTVLGIPADAELVVAARKRGPVNPSAPEEATGPTANLSVEIGDVLADSGIKIPPGERTAEVGIDGSFDIRGLDPSAKCELRVFELLNDRYVPRSEPLEVVPPLGSATLRYQAGATITARLVDASTGEPIRDAKIRAGFNRSMKVGDIEVPIGRLRQRQEAPDSEGLVLLTGLQGGGDRGGYAIEFDAEGYLLQKVDDIDLAPGKVTNLGTLRFALAPIVSLRVLDAATGKPIEGAEVRLGGGGEFRGFEASNGGNFVVASETVAIGSTESPGGPRAERSKTRETLETDAQGVAETPAQPGMLRYRINAEGYGPLRDEIDIAQSGRSQRTVELSRAATLAVTVVDARGVPVAESSLRVGAESIDSRREKTDENGQAIFENLPAGEVTVALRGKSAAGNGSSFSFQIDTGGGAVTVGDRDLSSETVTLLPGEVRELRIVQPDRANVTGVVTLDGAPLQGATISYQPQDPNQNAESQAAQDMINTRVAGLLGGMGGAKTDADGRFELENVEIGAGVLSINHPDLAMGAKEPIQIADGTNERTIALVTTRLTGRIIDAQGRPVGGARVTVSKDSQGGAQIEAMISFSSDTLGDFGIRSGDSVETDQDGRFEISGIAPNTDLAVSVKSDSGVARQTGVRAAPGSRYDVGTIQLEITGSLVVTVTTNAPFAVVMATLIDAAGQPTGTPKIQLARGGEARFKALKPGRYRINLQGNQEGAVDVTITGGQESRSSLDG